YSLAVASAAARSRSAATTRSPCAAKPRAMALPMPEPAPVTSAMLLMRDPYGSGALGSGLDVLREVGGTLLRERLGAFESFVGLAEQVECRHREVAQPGLVVGVGVEGLLEELDGGGALLGDLGGDGLGFVEQL